MGSPSRVHARPATPVKPVKFVNFVKPVKNVPNSVPIPVRAPACSPPSIHASQPVGSGAVREVSIPLLSSSSRLSSLPVPSDTSEPSSSDLCHFVTSLNFAKVRDFDGKL
jgi:hypothetical protein